MDHFPTFTKYLLAILLVDLALDIDLGFPTGNLIGRDLPVI
jgi:hypothetical protein